MSLYSRVVNYPTSTFLSRSSTRQQSAARSQPWDLISFLAVAQTFKIDFLPIIWQPARESLGLGGTAEVSQSSINLQISLAFKRVKRPIPDEETVFRILISEIEVLGNPSILQHPNIIKLEGICWDVSQEDDKVWPVLVFEKSQHGDIDRFANFGAGMDLCSGKRLKLCVDMIAAVMELHSNGERSLIDLLMS